MEIEYGFGTGDGHVSVWHSPADLDLGGAGVLDAVLLDFDGDGLVDDAMWDSDGDGVADTVVLGAVGEGPPRAFLDGAGDGTWSQEVPMPAGHDPDPDPGWPAAHPAPAGPAAEQAEDQTEAYDEAELPPDPAEPSSSAAPVVVPAPDGGGTLWVDGDGDGLLDTRLSDTTGDGLLDTAETVRPEEAVSASAPPDPADDGS